MSTCLLSGWLLDACNLFDVQNDCFAFVIQDAVEFFVNPEHAEVVEELKTHMGKIRRLVVSHGIASHCHKLMSLEI